jgi:hypothetical protein
MLKYDMWCLWLFRWHLERNSVRYVNMAGKKVFKIPSLQWRGLYAVLNLFISTDQTPNNTTGLLPK